MQLTTIFTALAQSDSQIGLGRGQIRLQCEHNTTEGKGYFQVVASQIKSDAKLRDLVDAMKDSCEFADQAEPLMRFSQRESVIVHRILQQVIQCTYFVKEYCRDSSFGRPSFTYATKPPNSPHIHHVCSGMRAIKSIASNVSEEMDLYIANLKRLQTSLGTASSIEGTVMIHRVAEDLLEQGETLKNIGE